MPKVDASPGPEACLPELVHAVRDHYARHGRDLPWRRTRDPWAVLVSEVMLQQTQVSRVVPKYEAFLDAFPTAEALAAAPLSLVLGAWQGLGYNRRAVSLKRAAEVITERFGGAVPRDREALGTLPGVGPATVAAVSAYAFGMFAPYIETNIRTVFLHHCFADEAGVRDRDLLPLVEASWDRDDPRQWGYALMDYGAWLKRTTPNPSRRSRHHVRQSRFEGSRRQLRARLLREVLAQPGASAEGFADAVGTSPETAAELLEELRAEGFLTRTGKRYSVA